MRFELKLIAVIMNVNIIWIQDICTLTMVELN